ncbi:hypothetical protein [uncultured Maribacter sp.]|uniref:hypothetical protein n=1 Tax=uncultured Maribacter sp. TaxID=431308 RepID=UPI0030D9C40E|tara:strand:+ start:438 stop:1205 length:768 start_codon:yes stop_codon:yes gene_type:complete
MNEKILSDEEVKTLFDEVIEHPLFVLELSEYEKSKILDIAFNEKNRIRIQATTFLNNPLDTSILNKMEVLRLNLIYESDLIDNLKEVPKENWLYYFLTEISENAIPLKVLFQNLGYNWNLQNGQVKSIEEPQPEFEDLEIDIEINDNWKKFIQEGNKLSIRQIALLCVYEDIFPSLDKEGTATKIVKFHGFNSPTSGQQLNQHYNKVRKSNDRIFVAGQKAMKNDIQRILPLISDLKKYLASNDISELEKIMNKE